MSPAGEAKSVDKDSIVVTIPQVWGVRNVLRSGLYARLSRDFRVLLGVPPAGIEALSAEGIPRRDLFPLHDHRPPGRARWLLTVLKAAHHARSATESDRILGGWHRRNRSAKGEAIDRVLAAAGRLLSSDLSYRALVAAERAAYEAALPRGVLDFIDRHRPVLGLSTSYFLGLEWPIHRALQARGIPTATQILSFDNVTSRGWLPLAPFDLFFVWQERMKQELVDFFGVPPARIAITGTPQFDFHLDPVWGREKTTRALGIDPSRRYAVYCANHKDLTPSEPAFVAGLLSRLTRDPELSRLEWVVRLHPLDDYGRWDELRQAFPRTAFSLPWRQAPGAAVWGVPTPDEIAALGNLLRHADAMLTVASTTVLDASVVDTPAICVGFNDVAPSAESSFAFEAHFSHHYEPILRSGAAPLASDHASLRRHLVEALTDPGARRLARARLVDTLCGPVDGRAAERIAGLLASRVGERSPAPDTLSELALSPAGK